MAEVQAGAPGQPTGSHRPAQRARRLLEEARDEVAAFLGRAPARSSSPRVAPSRPTWLSSGLCRGGAATTRGESVLLSSAVEHPAVLESCRAAAKSGLDVRELPVDSAGIVDPDALARTLSTRVTAWPS